MSEWNHFSFRPNSDQPRNNGYSNGHRGSQKQSPSHSLRNSKYEQPDSARSNFARSSGTTGQWQPRQAKADNDEKTAYAVNLQLKPVEMGIRVLNMGGQSQIQGLGAFNRYFGLLLPAGGFGYTIPDVWDGFFHVTLAKFCTHKKPEELEEIFQKFEPSIKDLPAIPEVAFRSSRIDIASGANRQGSRKGINFVVLPIDGDDQIKAFYLSFQPLLNEIKEQAQPYDWHLTALNDLHLTIRKYSNIDLKVNSIPISQYPIEFRCAHLEVKQTREQARQRYKRANPGRPYRWWSGMTDIDERCSGCRAPLVSSSWEGFCMGCGEYESIIPLWSTTGNKPKD